MEKNKTFCVIEDNIPNRKLFSMLIQRGGYKVANFGNASDALQWLKENNVDLIILDILLPDMNGSEVLSNIKQFPHLQNTKVIAITGFSSNYDKEKFLSMGFDGFMAKPIYTATFVSDLEKFLNN